MKNPKESGTGLSKTQSDADAFRQIIQSYGPMLARFVRFRIANPSDAEDVLQDTLVAVWLGFRHLRDPASLQGWVMHVARNRCRDYFRAQERRELPLEEEVLQDYASRFGLHQHRLTKTTRDVIDALEAAPLAVRETARRFYLEGLSIVEIAAQSQRPPGTVKRQLFQARRAARTFLGVSSPALPILMEKILMKKETAPDFPLTIPAIAITELDEPPFAVDCSELRSWPIIPRVGETGSFADYQLTEDTSPVWKLSEVTAMQALRIGRVHDAEGVEIEVRLWKPVGGWQRSGTVYARLTEDKAEFLAVHLPHEKFTQMETFLDSSFAWNWGTLERKISDDGLLRLDSDGSMLLSKALFPQRSVGVGFGTARVEISSKSFTCLRVLDIPDLAETANDSLTESYLTRDGRTILVRHYCRPGFIAVAEFLVVLDESKHLTINGIIFIHWYDTIAGLAIQG